MSYNVQPFFLTLADTVTLQTTAANLSGANPQDTFLVLYRNSFNAASPLTNALAADDDGVSSFGLSRISISLNAGQYFSVTTTFSNGVTGTFSERISAPTAVILPIAVPEPSTWAMLALGGVGLTLASARRRQATAA